MINVILVKIMKRIILASLFLSSYVAQSEEQSKDIFAPADPNSGYKEIIKKSQDSSLPVVNKNYIKRSANGKIKLRLSTNNQRSNIENKTAAGNSVIIGDGSVVKGDVIVNQQINGDTYVSGN